jgi:hypothetical protein
VESTSKNPILKENGQATFPVIGQHSQAYELRKSHEDLTMAIEPEH